MPEGGPAAVRLARELLHPLRQVRPSREPLVRLCNARLGRFRPALGAAQELLRLLDGTLLPMRHGSLHGGEEKAQPRVGRDAELEKLLEEKNKTDLLTIVRQISDMIHVAYVRQKEAMASSCRFRRTCAPTSECNQRRHVVIHSGFVGSLTAAPSRGNTKTAGHPGS